MTNRELLELAAKAAGIEHVTPMMVEWGKWNPLTDDGDALRLAVKLELSVYPPQPKTANYYASCVQNHEATIDCCEPSESDPYAATRRAIVRAAAEIGKGMK